jgi:hypothetical protein
MGAVLVLAEVDPIQPARPAAATAIAAPEKLLFRLLFIIVIPLVGDRAIGSMLVA